jgi:hypothetical protein
VKHPKAVTTVSATGGVSALLVAVVATGWTGIALLVIVLIVLIAALCWVLADSERPQRLALLLSTWRHSPLPPPPRQRAHRQACPRDRETARCQLTVATSSYLPFASTRSV